MIRSAWIDKSRPYPLSPLDLSIQPEQFRRINRLSNYTSSEMDVLLDRIALFNFYEGIYFQHLQGALNKEVWENWERSLILTMKNAEIRNAWESVKQVYNPKFSKYVNELAPLSSVIQDSE